MKFPAEVYTPAPCPYRGIGRVEYPMHDRTVTVTSCGRICMKGKKINLSTVFAGQDVGIKEVKEKIWLVSFMEYDLGYFDEDSRRFEPLKNPFGAKVLPMCPEWTLKGLVGPVGLEHSWLYPDIDTSETDRGPVGGVADNDN